MPKMYILTDDYYCHDKQHIDRIFDEEYFTFWSCRGCGGKLGP